MRQTVQPHYEFPEIPSLPEKKWNVEDKLDEKDVCLSSFLGTYLEILPNRFLTFFFGRVRILSRLLASYPSACEEIGRPTSYQNAE